jgi:hypothetical protein
MLLPLAASAAAAAAAAHLTMVRVSTLEALNEERILQGLHLQHLDHYKTINEAMALILAQLAAFLADVSRAVQEKHKPTAAAAAAARGSSSKRRRHGRSSRDAKPAQQLQQQWWGGQLMAWFARSKQQQQQHDSQTGNTSSSSPAWQSSPFAAAATSAPTAADSSTSASAAAAAAGPAEVLSQGGSTALYSVAEVVSKLERGGSGVTGSYLWEKKIGWEAGRQLMQR